MGKEGRSIIGGAGEMDPCGKVLTSLSGDPSYISSTDILELQPLVTPGTENMTPSSVL